MRTKRLAVAAAGAVWLGLVAGQGCPGFYASGPTPGAGGSTGNVQNDEPGTSSSGGGQDTGGAESPVTQVDITDFAFVPKTVTIAVGQTVRWINRDFTPHTVRSGDPEDADKGSVFRSGSLGVGKTFEHTFETPGVYEYHCQYHYRHAALRDATVVVSAAN